jgi:hypothetical protein
MLARLAFDRSTGQVAVTEKYTRLGTSGKLRHEIAIVGSVAFAWMIRRSEEKNDLNPSHQFTLD